MPRSRIRIMRETQRLESSASSELAAPWLRRWRCETRELLAWFSTLTSAVKGCSSEGKARDANSSNSIPAGITQTAESGNCGAHCLRFHHILAFNGAVDELDALYLAIFLDGRCEVDVWHAPETKRLPLHVSKKYQTVCHTKRRLELRHYGAVWRQSEGIVVAAVVVVVANDVDADGHLDMRRFSGHVRANKPK